MPFPQIADLLGADPSRPWPGIARDLAASEAGISAMSDGRRVERLERGRHSWPVPGCTADMVVAPLGWFTSADDVGSAVRDVCRFVASGGLLVTEELAPPDARAGIFEPVSIDVDRVVLAAVDSADGCFDVRLIQLMSGQQSVTAFEVSPLQPTELDAVMASENMSLVGRWGDWSGAPATGAPWHVAVHRASAGVLPLRDR